jgi:hypothetical protein
VCLPCPLGSYCSIGTTGVVTPMFCPAGTFAGTTALSVCVTCAANTWSNVGASVCSADAHTSTTYTIFSLMAATPTAAIPHVNPAWVSPSAGTLFATFTVSCLQDAVIMMHAGQATAPTGTLYVQIGANSNSQCLLYYFTGTAPGTAVSGSPFNCPNLCTGTYAYNASSVTNMWVQYQVSFRVCSFLFFIPNII